MKSLWDDRIDLTSTDNPLDLRVYTSQLLGLEPDLVLHGGGNTSVKVKQSNVYGEIEDIIYIKGSGWDLATIELAGFAPVKMNELLKMAELSHLTDSEMVRLQRMAMTDPSAPNPSVEAILHAIIPFRFVDHTHADSVVTITNSPRGEEVIKEIYGERVLIIPYVMPGFVLAREVFLRTRGLDWSSIEAIILMQHGVFTFNDDACESYETMIRIVSCAEEYIKKQKAQIIEIVKPPRLTKELLIDIARMRLSVGHLKKSPMLARFKNSPMDCGFASLPNGAVLATKGPLTPDHVIRTKRIAAVVGENPLEGIESFAVSYGKYFKQFAKDHHIMIDPAPRWAFWQNKGLVAFGASAADLGIVSDIVDHTVKAIQQATHLGGWNILSDQDLFDMEYWELEQAKLKKSARSLLFQGKVAIVTGAASGIGKACAEMLFAEGAAVVALDINPSIKEMFAKNGLVGFVCDLTKREEILQAIDYCVTLFGGIDIVVSNAGIFTPSETIAHSTLETWNKSLNINLSSHQALMQETIPYLTLGFEPTFIIIGSKNVPAPGPGVSAYSVAKAGLTQLARVAALELAGDGIRVNVVHPNQVFDTAIWTKEVLENRAQHYKMSVSDYKKNNLLKVEVTSKDVAQLVCSMASSVFGKTTGAQVSIDGGNDRVI